MGDVHPSRQSAFHAPAGPRLAPETRGQSQAPDAPGNLMVWLYTREPVYGYRAAGEWYDIGDLGQLLAADNMLRERAGLPTRDEYSLS